MTAVLAGQILGLAIACGLNLYAAVAALGIASRLGLIGDLPPGLMGLEGIIVIASALALFVIEAIVDRVPHFDSLWDAVHTFIRPPAGALLALGALWAAPTSIKIAGAAAAFLIALATHSAKAGIRLASHTRPDRTRPGFLTHLEDLGAIAMAIIAITAPTFALAVGAAAVILGAIVGPRFWRAFTLGMRCLIASVRAFFTPGRWREGNELPRDLRTLLGPQAIGAAPPRGTPAGIHGAPGVGAYRSGWLFTTPAGPVFCYRTIIGTRRFDLPAPREIRTDRGAWADLIHVANGGEQTLTVYLLKDGPAAELVAHDLGSRPG